MSTKKTGRRQLVGVVTSNKMTKTVVVRVTRLVRHPTYRRVMRRSEKFKAHDEGLKPRIGDEVRIEETRPLSKDKRWRLMEILRKSPELPEIAEQALP
ncbi:MAG: 30S ribosomal protein S17 [Candidatus Omnitrophica bacterium]|nr:30S ribosomal protein S17 [Candidatus Omnitrophota bacterium]